MTYFLGACIGEGVVEMDVWIQIFAEKLRIIFKVCFRREGKGRSPKCGEVWGGVGVKNYWKYVDILHGCPSSLWLDKTFENTQKCSKTEGSQLIDIRVDKMQNDLPQRQISNIRSKFLRILVHKKSSDLIWLAVRILISSREVVCFF